MPVTSTGTPPGGLEPPTATANQTTVLDTPAGFTLIATGSATATWSGTFIQHIPQDAQAHSRSQIIFNIVDKSEPFSFSGTLSQEGDFDGGVSAVLYKVGTIEPIAGRTTPGTFSSSGVLATGTYSLNIDASVNVGSSSLFPTAEGSAGYENVMFSVLPEPSALGLAAIFGIVVLRRRGL
jgi:hypothetical protein